MMEKFFTNRFKDLLPNPQNSARATVTNPAQGGKSGYGEKFSQKVSSAIGNVKRVTMKPVDQQTQATVHSPSDITVYAPALQKHLSPQITSNLMQAVPVMNENVINNEQLIVDFIESVHNDRPQPSPENDGRLLDTSAVNELKDAQRRAEKTLLEAEKFRAQVEPPGMYQSEFEGKIEENRRSLDILDIGKGVSDDDFFHLTCHIDPSLIHKIEKGKFVELEKLLPKEKLGRNSEDNRLEWVQRDGGTYLVPAQKDNKISSFRKWEQAFRGYATIYCGANPHRSKEIWQYITVINTAASSYLWDNMYNYDITFRHLMAFNPQRSWAVTYNQMWNLSMRDPLPKNNGKTGFVSHYSGGGYVNTKGYSNGASGTNSNPMQVRRNKSDYCWNFNKGVPCKFGAKCKFIERCKYCDSPSHGDNACVKLQRKEGSKNNQGSQQSHQSAASGSTVSK